MTEEYLLRTMSYLRFLSAAVEATAAVWMLRSHRLETAVGINASLGLFGPTIFLLVSLLGLVGLAGKLPLAKLALIGAGVGLVFLGASVN